MRLVNNRVAVRPLQQADEQRTESGLIIPDTAASPIAKGVVVHIGAAVEGLEAGDVVLYEKGKGVQADDLLVLNEYELLAKEEQQKPV